MKRVLTAVILIPIVVLALFRAPLWLFALLVLGVALLAAREYLDIAEATGFRPMRHLSYFFLVCVCSGSRCMTRQRSVPGADPHGLKHCCRWLGGTTILFLLFVGLSSCWPPE